VFAWRYARRAAAAATTAAPTGGYAQMAAYAAPPPVNYAEQVRNTLHNALNSTTLVFAMAPSSHLDRRRRLPWMRAKKKTECTHECVPNAVVP
jgi:hypothetical protein